VILVVVVCMGAAIWFLRYERPSHEVIAARPEEKGVGAGTAAQEEKGPPPDWGEQIESAVSELDVSPEEMFWTMIESSPIITLDQREELLGGFQNVPVRGAEELSEERLDVLKDLIAGISIAMMQEDREKGFLDYARVLTGTGAFAGACWSQGGRWQLHGL